MLLSECRLRFGAAFELGCRCRLHGVRAVSRFDIVVCARSLAVARLLQGAAAVLLQGAAAGWCCQSTVRAFGATGGRCRVLLQGCCCRVLLSECCKCFGAWPLVPLQGACVGLPFAPWSLAAGAAAGCCCKIVRMPFALWSRF